MKYLVQLFVVALFAFGGATFCKKSLKEGDGGMGSALLGVILCIIAIVLLVCFIITDLM